MQITVTEAMRRMEAVVPPDAHVGVELAVSRYSHSRRETEWSVYANRRDDIVFSECGPNLLPLIEAFEAYRAASALPADDVDAATAGLGQGATAGEVGHVQ